MCGAANNRALVHFALEVYSEAMAPVWLGIIYSLVFLVIWGIAVTFLVWPRKVQAFAMRMLKDRPAHPLFGPPTPESIYANIIICGIGSIIPTIILIRVLIKLIGQAWNSN
jgi:hypothetical protein